MRMNNGNKSIIMFLALVALIFPIRTSAEEPAFDVTLAEKYLNEAEALCRRDGLRLWGASLCGPILFVERETRAVVANQGDAQGLLTKKGDVFVGKLPDEENIANTATKWAGVKWTMLVWPVPENDFDRARLMVHELFHRVQDDLGLPMSNPSNDQLDSREGRIWLQLEWRALREALKQHGPARRGAIEDALAFRSYRRTLFPGSDSAERALEMNEGLAEYTGGKLGAQSEAQLIDYVVKQIDRAPDRPTFVRSFAYVSGPAYGVLLDLSGANWRHALRAQDDLGKLLQRALSIELPSRLKERAEKRAAVYDGDALRSAEAERESVRQKRMAEYRARLVDGPVLLIPLTESVRYSFNPNDLIPLEGSGTVYPTLRVSDQWGILEVSNGALMIREGGKVSGVYVSARGDLSGQPLRGDGWTLRLNDGWKLAPGAQKGNYLLKKDGSPVNPSARLGDTP